MSINPFNTGNILQGDDGMFAIHGSLDGQAKEEFSTKQQYIGLHVGGELFYLSLSQVSEIIMLEPIRYVPSSPQYIDGVINLRGTILPAINLGKLAGLDHKKPSASTRIIIVKHQELTAGIIVDALSTVIGLSYSDIEDKSLGGHSQSSNVISQIVKNQDRIAGIIDIEKIMQLAGNKIPANEESTESAS